MVWIIIKSALYLHNNKNINIMKKVLFLLVTLSLMTSCVGVKNTINRANVAEGESFIKYGVEGFPEGVEVYKGSECHLTNAEIKSRDKELEKQKRKKQKNYEKEQQKKYDELRKIAEEFSKNYVDSSDVQ